MLLPTLSDLSPTTPLHTWLRHYCRLGYEVTLNCRGPKDPSPFCQQLAVRRQALREATQLQVCLRFGLDEGPAHELFAQWSRDLFGQLLAQDTMRYLTLEIALTEPLPTPAEQRRAVGRRLD